MSNLTRAADTAARGPDPDVTRSEPRAHCHHTRRKPVRRCRDSSAICGNRGRPCRPRNLLKPTRSAHDETLPSPWTATITIVELGRIAWICTVMACLVTVAILLIEGYYGYAEVTFAVAVSAGINLA